MAFFFLTERERERERERETLSESVTRMESYVMYSGSGNGISSPLSFSSGERKSQVLSMLEGGDYPRAHSNPQGLSSLPRTECIRPSPRQGQGLVL
jgi:hypothetical protein